MKRILGIAVLILSNLLVLPAWSMDLSPDKLVDRTVKEVIEIIQKDEELKSGNRDKMLDLIETKILPHFNFSRMTQLAMGQHWSTAAPEQKNKLVDEFRTLLVRTYSNALTSYNHETINVNPVKQLGDQVEITVRTVVIQGNGKEPIPIDYSMEKKSDGWKVFDVTVAGVSLVTNYRGTFNSQVRKGGVEGLLKVLTDKNKSLEGKK
ncbi:phospholipid-binding protein MlaC [Nitrosomonas sp.]|uniref:MlaC/ttg2D family ABC transporter substrate-binding protein n=1 Tax=Nitrosomonas sp. TaxID=42353 RepID=UPI00374DE9DE